MSLRLYFDSGLTEPLQLVDDTAGEPDEVREAVEAGGNIENIISLYLATDDEDLTYEEISMTSIEAPETGEKEVTVDYRIAGDTTWESTLTIPDDAYRVELEIERRVRAENIENAFYRDDIEHQLNYHEFVDTDYLGL